MCTVNSYPTDRERNTPGWCTILLVLSSSSSSSSSSIKKPAPESIVLETLADVAPSTADNGRLANLACRSIKARCRFRSIFALIAAESSVLGVCCESEPTGSCVPDSDWSILYSHKWNEWAKPLVQQWCYLTTVIGTLNISPLPGYSSSSTVIPPRLGSDTYAIPPPSDDKENTLTRNDPLIVFSVCSNCLTQSREDVKHERSSIFKMSFLKTGLIFINFDGGHPIKNFNSTQMNERFFCCFLLFYHSVRIYLTIYTVDLIF